MTKVYELPDDKRIMADVDEIHHTATVSVCALDDLVAEVNKKSDGIPFEKIMDDIYDLDRYYIHDKAGYVTDERVSYYDVINVIDKYWMEQE